ncbi:hypothetical protein SHIRM173S_10209 [Streptomyces hirsutus]
MSTPTPPVPGAAKAASTYAMAIGLPRVGEGAPEVTSPITLPSSDDRETGAQDRAALGDQADQLARRGGLGALGGGLQRLAADEVAFLLELHDPAETRVEGGQRGRQLVPYSGSCPPPGAACPGRRARTGSGRAAPPASVSACHRASACSGATNSSKPSSQMVFDEVVQDLRGEARVNRMAPVDFSSAAPGHDLVRPARTDVQVLGPDGRIVDPGDPGLPVVAADRAVAGAATAGRVVEHADVDVGDDIYRVATVALGDGRGAVQVAQEFSDTEDLLRTLQRRTLVLMAAVVTAAGLFGWWLARRITRRLAARPPPPRTSPAPAGSASRCPSPVTTRWGGSAAPSTGCSAGSPSPRTTSADSSRTRATNCAPRSPPCGPTSPCCAVSTSSLPTPARNSSPTSPRRPVN